jgi:hypothetical protein
MENTIINKLTIVYIIISILLIIIGIQNKIVVQEALFGWVKKGLKKIVSSVSTGIKKSLRFIKEGATSGIKAAFSAITGILKKLNFVKKFYYYVKYLIESITFLSWADKEVPNLISQFKSIPQRLPNYMIYNIELVLKDLTDRFKNILDNIKMSFFTPLSISKFIDLIIHFPSRILEILICPIIYIIKNVLKIPINHSNVNDKCYGKHSILGLSDFML